MWSHAFDEDPDRPENPARLGWEENYPTVDGGDAGDACDAGVGDEDPDWPENPAHLGWEENDPTGAMSSAELGQISRISSRQTHGGDPFPEIYFWIVVEC